MEENKMTKLHHTAYKKNYKKYILECVELDNDEKELKTDQEKVKYIFDRFYSEFDWNVKRIGKQKAMIKNILNFLDYVLFLAMFYIIYLGLKHGPQIEQLIIELKGGAI
jgi:hypothetical protein